MSAREEILARVREALSGVAPTGIGYDASPRSPRTTDLLGLFAARVRDYRAVVERCAAAELAERVEAAVSGVSVVVPPGLGLAVPGAVADDPHLSAGDLDAIGAVVTRARIGIAETGTIVLDHTPDQGRRILSLVPDLHVCIVAAEQVVPDVPEAVALLDPSRPSTWISGPSATSDIELHRVEGVHGPRRLHVLLIDPEGGEDEQQESRT